MKDVERLGWGGFVAIEVDIEDSVFSLSSYGRSFTSRLWRHTMSSMTEVGALKDITGLMLEARRWTSATISPMQWHGEVGSESSKPRPRKRTQKNPHIGATVIIDKECPVQLY